MSDSLQARPHSEPKCRKARNFEARHKTSASYTTGRNLKLHKCQDVRRAKSRTPYSVRQTRAPWAVVRASPCFCAPRWPTPSVSVTLAEADGASVPFHPLKGSVTDSMVPGTCSPGFHNSKLSPRREPVANTMRLIREREKKLTPPARVAVPDDDRCGCWDVRGLERHGS